MVRRLLSTFVPVLILGAGLLHAQSEAMNDYLDRGRELSKAEKFDQALPYFLFALELGEKEFGADSPAVVPLLNDLAETYAQRSDYGDAEPLFERSLEIQEGELTRYRAGVARTLNHLGAIYEATARPERARKAYSRVLAKLQPGLGAADPNVQTARLRLAALERAVPPPRIAEVTPPPAPAPTPPAPAPPAPAPTEVAAPPAPAEVPAYRVHISSVRRAGQTAPEWRRLQQLYPELLGDLELAVTRVDLGPARGIWYRVLGGPLAPAEAQARCDAFTRRGVWCAVRRGAAAPVEVVAEAVPPPVAPPAAPAPAEPDRYRIHLTSIRDPEDAAAEWARLRRRFMALLEDLGLTVMRADLGAERGVWYRIQAGPLARAEARARCTAFAARDQWCRVVPPPGNTSESNLRYLALRVRRRSPARARGTRRPRPGSAPEPGARRFCDEN